MNTMSSVWGSDAERAVQTLMRRLIDVRNGFEKMVAEAREDFEPIAREFRDLHDKHVAELRSALKDEGFDADENGSFMSQVNEAVVAARAYFSEIDDDVMAQVRSGEQHVINAFDDAVRKVESSGLTEKLEQMREEMKDTIARTRHLG